MTQRWLLVFLGISFLIYLPSVLNGFAMDGRDVAKAVLDNGRPNRMVDGSASLGEYFTTNYWSGADRKSGALYRPITILSYAIVYATLSGTSSELAEAWPQHLVNILLHLLAVWLVYRMARRVCARGPSVVAAGVFALHAIHSEVVSGIVGRAELLSFCFGATAVLLFESGFRKQGRDRVWRFVGAGFGLLLAFGSKESGLAWAPFLLVFVLAVGLREGTENFKRMLREAGISTLVVSLVPLILFLAARHAALGSLPEQKTALYLVNPLVYVPAGVRICTATSIWGYGLLKTVLPLHLVSDYGPAVFSMIASPADHRFWVSLLVLLLVLGIGLLRARRDPLLLLAAAALLGFSFLTSNVPLAIGTIFGERLLFVPSLACAFVAAWLAMRVPVKLLTAGKVVLGIWLVLGCFVILSRNGVWSDNKTLFLTDAPRQPRSARLQRNAADSVDPGDLPKRRMFLERAVAAVPEYGAAWTDLADVYQRSGALEHAEACLRKALTCPREIDGGDRYAAHIKLALLLIETKRAKEAQPLIERAFELRSRMFAGQISRLLAHVLTKVDYGWLMGLLERVARRVPDVQNWHIDLGQVAFEYKDYERSVAEFRKVKELSTDPELRAQYYLLAVGLARTGDKAGATKICNELLATKDLAPPFREMIEKLVAEIERG